MDIFRNGEVITLRDNVIDAIKPGEWVMNKNPGGGGYGNPMERSVDKVVSDVRNELVSIEGAREDYGVVFVNEAKLQVDMDATSTLRKKKGG